MSVKFVVMLDDKHAKVYREPKELTVVRLSNLMDSCLPRKIEDERDMQKLIDKLWPALIDIQEV